MDLQRQGFNCLMDTLFKPFSTSQTRYRRLLNKADQIEVISSGDYSSEAMQLRNQWILNHCDRLMALWHSDKGGTKNCVDYALAINRPTFNCWATFRYFYHQF